jgi:hypothetical protein
MDRTDLLVRGFVQPLAPAAAGLAFVFGIFALTGLDSLAGRAAVALAAVATVFGVFYFFVAGPEERRQFRDFVNMVRERMGGVLGRSSDRKESSDA